MKKILQRILNDFSTHYKHQSNNQVLEQLGFPVKNSIPIYIRNSIRYLRDLHQIPNTKFILNVDNLQILIKELNFTVTTQEEIFILREIFVDGIYNFEFSQPCIVIDIGMNVGFSSLFFAKKNTVHKVFGYEPFKPTYLRALQNIQQNPEISQKIEAINLGISNQNETRTVNYCDSNKGSVTITDDKNFSQKIGSKITREKVSIIAADEVLLKISQEYCDKPIICKIDCEGSEYAIFKSLESFKREQLPDAFMVEWHYKGPQEIINFFSSKNYFINWFGNDKGIGMLYATKIQDFYNSH